MESANTTMVPIYTWMAKSNATHQFSYKCIKFIHKHNNY